MAGKIVRHFVLPDDKICVIQIDTLQDLAGSLRRAGNLPLEVKVG